MPPINCMRCHRVFQPVAYEKICPKCQEESENVFHRIKDYLYEHPGASAAIVANVLDIPISIIKYYLREGRLEVAGETNSFFTCEKCGTPIKTGRLCDVCEKGSNNDINRDSKNDNPKLGSDMERSGENQSKSGKSRMEYKKNK